MKTPIKSEHLFIFPFSWKDQSKGSYGVFRQLNQMQHKRLEQLKNWKPHYSSIESDKDYNEYVYFYKPIRMALYSFKDEGDIVKNYDYEGLFEDSSIELETRKKCYKLQMKQIELKLYKTGIGLLCFRIVNDTYDLLEDIEAINSFSMCVYPPVLPIEKSVEIGMPTHVRLHIRGKEIIEEDFIRKGDHQKLSISLLIMQVLGPSFTDERSLSVNKSFYIEPILGSQMFCSCMYYNEALTHKLFQDENERKILTKLMSSNKQNHTLAEMDRRSEEEGSYYLRGEEHFYGMNPYILLCMTQKETHDKFFDQLVKLILMQRATLLNLSSELAYVSTLPKSELPSAIATVYEIYIQFINQLYFKEVTEDAEGSYIYEQLSKAFKISEELEQLIFEVDEVHEYANLVEQADSNLKVQFLTIIGAALVIPSFVTGFFGMNVFKDEALHWWQYRNVILWLNAYVVLPILTVVALCLWTKKRSAWMLIFKVMMSVLFLVSLSFTFKYGSGL